MTVAGVARVGVISGQEQAKQEARLRSSPQNQVVHHLGDSDSASLQDTVTLSGSGRRARANAPSSSWRPQLENQGAIAAYEAIQPGRGLDAVPSDSPTHQPDPLAQVNIDIRG